MEVSPLWQEADGRRRPPDEDEVREDLPCVGWVTVLVIEGLDETPRRLLAVFEDEVSTVDTEQ